MLEQKKIAEVEAAEKKETADKLQELKQKTANLLAPVSGQEVDSMKFDVKETIEETITTLKDFRDYVKEVTEFLSKISI